MDQEASQHNRCCSKPAPKFTLELTWEDLIREHIHILGMPTKECVAPPASVVPLLHHAWASVWNVKIEMPQLQKNLGTSVHCFPKCCPILNVIAMEYNQKTHKTIPCVLQVQMSSPCNESFDGSYYQETFQILAIPIKVHSSDKERKPIMYSAIQKQQKDTSNLEKLTG